MGEQAVEFECFGSTVLLRAGHQDGGLAAELLSRGREIAEQVHRVLTRFEPDSELSRLNADPRRAVSASPLLLTFAHAVADAGRATGGLVDATMLDAVIAAGYDRHWAPGSRMHPTGVARPASGAWSKIEIHGDTIVRPPGVQLDSGGLGKGLAADLIGECLAPCRTWLADCGGDLRLGGTAGLVRPVEVKDPHDPSLVVACFELRRGGVATSGTTRRRWEGGHHLIDPRTGAPANSDVLQVTALAPTALVAEARAKAAVLSGVGGAAPFLADGGHVVGVC